jgi:hypothetical protein
MVAKVVACLDIGLVFRMNGLVYELFGAHSNVWSIRATVEACRTEVKRESISCLFECSSHFQVIIRYLFNCEFHHTVYFWRTTPPFHQSVASNGLMYMYQSVDMQHFQYFFWNVTFNCTAGCCSIRENSLPTLVLTLMLQHGGIILLSFYDQDCQRSSLRCTFPSQTGRGYNASSGRRIFFSSFRSSVHELCSTCFQISHIACNYAEGSIQVWNNVAWEAECVVLLTFLLLFTW